MRGFLGPGGTGSIKQTTPAALFRQVGEVGVDDILKLVIVAVGKH